jgi:anaerobic selenocysteine-containing dehydrogenase
VIAEGYQPPLRVAAFVATTKDDADRGPIVRMHPSEARKRVMEDGELVWVFGPRRHELALLKTDESVPLGELFARDVPGVAPSEIVRVVKHDFDAARTSRNLG